MHRDDSPTMMNMAQVIMSAMATVLGRREPYDRTAFQWIYVVARQDPRFTFTLNCFTCWPLNLALDPAS